MVKFIRVMRNIQPYSAVPSALHTFLQKDFIQKNTKTNDFTRMTLEKLSEGVISILESV